MDRNRNSLFCRKFLSAIRSGMVALFLLSLTPLTFGGESQIDKTKQAIQDGSRESMEATGTFIESVNENGVQHWTHEEIVAWLIIGLLVASAAGIFSSMKKSGLGRMGLFVLGLIGALLGCTLVRVAAIDYEWGAAVISYEALVYSFGAALLLIASDRALRRRMSKKKKKA